MLNIQENMKTSWYNKYINDYEGGKQKIQRLMHLFEIDIKDTKRDLKSKKELLNDVDNLRKRWTVLGDSNEKLFTQLQGSYSSLEQNTKVLRSAR